MTQVRLFLLPKVRKPADWDEYRGICLLNVVPKFYMPGIMILLRDWASVHLGGAWQEAPLFGFEQTCKCEDLLMSLQCRVAMAVEWPRQHPVVIASTDIKQAFDYVTPEIVADCMEYWRFPEILTRGLVRESLGATTEAVCPGIPHTREFALQTAFAKAA